MWDPSSPSRREVKILRGAMRRPHPVWGASPTAYRPWSRHPPTSRQNFLLVVVQNLLPHHVCSRSLLGRSCQVLLQAPLPVPTPWLPSVTWYSRWARRRRCSRIPGDDTPISQPRHALQPAHGAAGRTEGRGILGRPTVPAGRRPCQMHQMRWRLPPRV
jgi:hypothetical protein